MGTHSNIKDGSILECLRPVSLYLLPGIILVPVLLSLVAHTQGVEKRLILESGHLSICRKSQVTPRDTRVTEDLLSRSLITHN